MTAAGSWALLIDALATLGAKEIERRQREAQRDRAGHDVDRSGAAAGQSDQGRDEITPEAVPHG
jgi:hypothetical protein